MRGAKSAITRCRVGVEPMFDDNFLRQAKSVGAATLHEAAGRTGALPSTIKPVVSGWRLSGPALTIATTPRNNVWIHDALAVAAPGSVLVVSCGGLSEAGYWGDIMSNAAVARGLGGLVIEGHVRDAEDLREIGFPVFSTGLCIQGTTKERRPAGTVGAPVRIGAVTVETGDLVVGDDDGVVVVAKNLAASAVERSFERIDSEEAIRERLLAGETTLDIYSLHEKDR